MNPRKATTDAGTIFPGSLQTTDQSRATVSEVPVFIERYLELGRLTNPRIRCAGVSINTSRLQGEQRGAYLRRLSEELRMPCVDPMSGGVGPIADVIEREF